MRILNISFRNLNSLAGDWSINLRAPEFETSGIFAITGPTGAGKSTILDAICLALYGSTPRLGKVSKGANDIMTRGTGDCFADVTFSTRNGEFRCRWSQRRAHGKADGELQQSKHELFDVKGVSLADKIHEVASRVEELTGMDFERFTQSALLAQGRFATFLLAEGRDRAPLLEQLTGTEIYSRISIHVFRRCKAEQERLAALDAELASLSVLSEDEENALREHGRCIAEGAADFDAQEKTLNSQLNTLRTHSALKKELETLAAEKVALDKQTEDFREDRSRLETARRALHFSGDCSALLARQSEQIRDREEAQRLNTALGPLTTCVEERGRLQQAAENAFAQSRQETAKLQELLKTVRSLDVQISERSDELRFRDASCRKAQKAQENAAEQLARHEQELRQALPSLEEKKLWIEEHAADSSLAGKLGGLRVACAQLEQLEQRMRARALLTKEKEKQLEQKKQDSEKLRRDFESIVLEQKKQEAGQNEHTKHLLALLEGKSASDWRQEKERLSQLTYRLDDAADKIRRHAILLSQEEHLKVRLIKLHYDIGQKQALRDSEQAHLEEASKLKQETAETLFLLERIRSYEEERLHLKDGEACPLCGSVHHPFAQDRAPAPDEKKAQLAECEKKIEALRASLSLLQAELAALERDEVHELSLLQEKSSEADALLSALTSDSDWLPLKLVPSELEDSSARSDFLDSLEKARADAQKNADRATDIIRQIDEEQAQADRLRLLLEQTRECTERSRQALQLAEQEQAVLNAELRALAAEQDAAQAQHENSFNEQRLAFAGLGYAVHATSDLPEALRGITERSAYFQNVQEELARLSAHCSDLEKMLLVDRQELNSTDKQLQDADQARKTLSSSLSLLQEKRRELFGEKDCGREEEEAASRLRHAEEHCAACLSSLDEARQQKADTAASLAALEKKIVEREGQLAADGTALLSRLQEAGFSSPTVCMQACLSEEERQFLETREQELSRALASLNARLKDSEQKLADIRELPSRTEVELLADIEESRSRKASLMEELGALREKLDSNESKKKAAADVLASRTSQEKSYRRWADLNELIGSADGKKFRNYAQELTFRILIRHANRQLRAMTDRYQLVQDPKEALSLAVIDRYQADAVRTSRNLSGGESFLVSLSLALGLARMASRKVNVDSVFLDEGFGTLDEDALNTALDMLSSLRQQGKTIGIISHVQAIRDRIGTRLHIEPEGNGRSRIVGPGVSRPDRKKA